MSKYRFSYQTIDTYDRMVSNFHFMLRCVPCENQFQRVEEHQLHLLSSVDINCSKDTFGNVIHYGVMKEKHDIFVVASSGIVDCDNYALRDINPLPIFKVNSHLTQLNAEMLKFNKEITAKGNSLETALCLSQEVYKYMKYTPGVTNISTTAIDSFTQGEGVCQDYSHILLALCRERGLYARYVVGFVVGTGETHSWVEVFSEGMWYGIDPTHNKQIESGYIKVSHGRDASDCSVIRGLRCGLTNHTAQIRVIVEQI